jgi:class 3 adenylate cyclase
MMDWVTSLEGRWEEPLLADALLRLASFSRLITFDKRGIGLSDPVSIDVLTTPEEWIDDAITVLDACGSERAAVLGTSDGGFMAMLLAAMRPDRVSSLVLANTAARLGWAPDYPHGVTPDAQRFVLDYLATDWATGDLLDVMAPGIGPAVKQRFAKWRRYQASPGAAIALFEMFFALDARGVLSSIRCPTLVLQPEGPTALTPNGWQLAQELAAGIPGARIEPLAGNDDLWWASNADAVVDAVQQHVTGRRAEAPADRVLLTVLFTDIVSSTEHALAAGDRTWRQTLERHDGELADVVARQRGRVVKSTGDGVLAIFDGPARGVRAALAAIDSARTLGIEIRAGLHTGEVELRGDDIGGIAVHLASRVSAAAAAGEVLVSSTVRDLVAGSELDFEDLGEHQLKGIADPRRLWRATN